ncbi:hypothetical protein J8F10_03540 [Gemmata sp. G18]|uniref:HIRAN domain-containing protein n=1 Tax=Gemmata palustris TaxID=2822762 RepID=A0ABS5BKY1_9BACT|nr:hypothetical protein [Gemmata palustris]MBP3954370.1 hypothetical protein [Gemmata palustris]
MARRKKAKEPTAAETPTEQPQPVATEPAPVESPRISIQPENIVHAPATEPAAAEQSRSVEAERHAAHENGQSPHHEHAHHSRHPQHREPSKSHAEAVGKRQPRYNEQGKTDYVVGVRVFEHHDPYLSIIKFDEKPSDAVRGKMREAGFTFRSENREWTRPINFETRVQDRVHADRVFEEVCQMTRKERGITHDFGGAS